MATSGIVGVESTLVDLEKLLHSLEIENKYQQIEIQQEEKQATVFEAAISEKERDIKKVQEDIASLDEETKAAHQQFCHNKETCDSLKSHQQALMLNRDSVAKDLDEMKDRWQSQQAQHQQVLQHYESVWESYKAKYEERELAVQLRQWQQRAEQTRQRLGKSQHKLATLKAALQEKQDVQKKTLKPFKSLNTWIIQLSELWLSIRDLRKAKQDTQGSIDDATLRLQGKKERQLRQQKEKEELEHRASVKEAEEKQHREEMERQKQQQFQQQQHVMQQQEQQQELMRQQQLQASAAAALVPRSPLQLPSRRTPLLAQSQYFRSPLVVGGAMAACFSPAAAVAPASPAPPLRQPPYLQMPTIMASPRRPVAAAASTCLTNVDDVQQKYTLSRPDCQITVQRPQLTVQQPSDAPARSAATQAPQPNGVNKSSDPALTNPRVTVGQNQSSVADSQTTGQTNPQPQPQPPHPQSETVEEGREIQETASDGGESSEPGQQAPSLVSVSFPDPATPGSVASLMPQSPFDLETHLQSLNEMAKSPGFSYSFRPMFGGQDEMRNEASADASGDAHPPTSSSPSSDNYESSFFKPFFAGVGEANQASPHMPAPTFGSGNQPKEQPRPSFALNFGGQESPMDVGSSGTPEGVLSLFGGGQDKVDKSGDGGTAHTAPGFSFNFAGVSDSSSANSSGKPRFSLF